MGVNLCVSQCFLSEYPFHFFSKSQSSAPTLHTEDVFLTVLSAESDMHTRLPKVMHVAAWYDTSGLQDCG